ncbi:MAG TPA: sialidase family protein [Candidatus Limnocylindrales bacterium]
MIVRFARAGRAVRRLLVLVSAAAVIAVTLGTGASAATPHNGPTRQEFMTKLLERQHGKLLSASARLGLRAIAAGDRAEKDTDKGLSGGEAKRASGGGSGLPTAGVANVRVNNPATDTNQVDQTTQSETAMAVSGRNIVVGYNDSQHTLPGLTAGSNLTGYSYSTDGGATFTDGGALPNLPEFINLGDPWLGSDRSGAMYFSNLAIDFVNGNLDIAVATSSDGGRTWGAAKPIVRPNFDVFYSGDKEALAVGPDPKKSNRDNVYVAWDDFSFDARACAEQNICQQINGLPVARSTDGGATWQVTYADKFVADFNDPNLGCSFGQYIGAYPIVDHANGDLYVAAERFAVDDPTCTGGTFTSDISVFRSTDGGVTFGSRVKIADVTPSFAAGALVLGPAQYVRNLEFPTLAFAGNALFAAWNDGASGNSHIALAKSTNHAGSWTVSPVTAGTNDEFQPALSGDAAGLHLLYYRRNADNTLDAVVGNSTNGNTFDAHRVSTVAFPGVPTLPQFDPIIAFTYMGDYIANVSDGSHRYFAWGDNRDTVTNFLWSAGRHDPNVYFGKQ